MAGVLQGEGLALPRWVGAHQAASDLCIGARTVASIPVLRSLVFAPRPSSGEGAWEPKSGIHNRSAASIMAGRRRSSKVSQGQRRAASSGADAAADVGVVEEDDDADDDGADDDADDAISGQDEEAEDSGERLQDCAHVCRENGVRMEGDSGEPGVALQHASRCCVLQNPSRHMLQPTVQVSSCWLVLLWSPHGKEKWGTKRPAT